jgi:hypothetical protein
MDDIDENLLADAAFPVPDHMPEEIHFWYDEEHPVIEEGSLFSSIEEFRMLLRTFAIRGKFDIQIQHSDTTRFIGHCKGKICHWRITARTIEDGKTVRVLTYLPSTFDVTSCNYFGKKLTDGIVVFCRLTK